MQELREVVANVNNITFESIIPVYDIKLFLE